MDSQDQDPQDATCQLRFLQRSTECGLR
jgi:hypothetical protein